MPNGNRMGPTGQGPMTGRAQGLCAGNAVPGAATAPGRGRRGFGGGGGNGGGGNGGGGDGGGGRQRRRGRRNQYRATGLTGVQRAAAETPAFGDQQQAVPAPPASVETPPPDRKQELDMLKLQAEVMEKQMQQIRERMETLEAKE